MEVIRLKKTEKKTAAEVMARSFFNYPMVAAFFPDKARRSRHLDWYLGCMINYGLRYGEVYTTPDIAGISIWLPPGQTHCTLWRYLMSGYIFTPAAVGFTQYPIVMKSDDHLIKIHLERMPGRHWYLWALASDPDRQGTGVGTALLQPGLEQADSQSLPCYLETHDSNNVAFYKKRGFADLGYEQIPGVDLGFWCMVRQPGD